MVITQAYLVILSYKVEDNWLIPGITTSYNITVLSEWPAMGHFWDAMADAIQTKDFQIFATHPWSAKQKLQSFPF